MKQLHIRLPDRVRRLAQVRAAQQGVTVSEHVATVLFDDAVSQGAADLVVEPPLDENEESGHD